MVFGRRTRSQTRAAAGSSSQEPQPQPQQPAIERPGEGPDFVRDPEVAKYEKKMGFTMPWSFQFKNYLKLRKRTFEHTRFMDMHTLEKFGVAEQFLELSSKVGITPNFWTIRECAHLEYTMEFLSSLKLMQDEEGVDFIVYRLGNENRKVKLDVLGRLFFLENGTLEEFHYTRGPNDDANREIVWRYICGKGQKYQARLVQHPTLRILLRGIAATVFARYETVNLAQEKDVAFLWHMLQPEPEKVNIIKLMVKHWIYQRDLKNATGSISMGSFLTLIAKRLDLPLPSTTTCTGYTHYDDERFAAASFLKICHTGASVNEKYLWLRDQGSNFFLPYPHRIDVLNRSTWLVPHNYVTPRGPIAPQFPDPIPAPMELDTQASTSHHRPSTYEPQPPQWAIDLQTAMGDLTRLTIKTSDDVRRSIELQNDHGMQLSRLSNEFLQFGKRLDIVSDVTFDNNFFLKNGYWPGEEGDPNLSPVPSNLSPIPSPSFSSIPSVRSTASPSHQPVVEPPPYRDPFYDATVPPSPYQPPFQAQSDPNFYPHLGYQMPPSGRLDEPDYVAPPPPYHTWNAYTGPSRSTWSESDAPAHLQQPQEHPGGFFDIFPTYDERYRPGHGSGGPSSSH